MGYSDPTNEMPLSILVVSCQATIRMNIERALKPMRYDVYTASSGKRAIELDKNHMTNLIIADVTLPDMPIDEMLLKIREYRRLMKDVVENEYVPVLLIASLNERLNEARLKTLGVLARLNKPLNLGLIKKFSTKILLGELKLEKDRLLNLFILDPEQRALEYFSKLLRADDLNIGTSKDVIDLYSSMNGNGNIDILIVEAMIDDKPVQFVNNIQTRSPKTEIMICTALHDASLLQEYRNMNIQTVMTKPVNPIDMRNSVRQIVSNIQEKELRN